MCLHARFRDTACVPGCRSFHISVAPSSICSQPEHTILRGPELLESSRSCAHLCQLCYFLALTPPEPPAHTQLAGSLLYSSHSCPVSSVPALAARTQPHPEQLQGHLLLALLGCPAAMPPSPGLQDVLTQQCPRTPHLASLKDDSGQPVEPGPKLAAPY